MEQVLRSLRGMYPVSENLMNLLPDHTSEVVYRRKHFLLKEGQICNYVYFINSGLLRHFSGKGDKTVTPWLLSENHFCTDLESLLNRTPASENIELLEDCRLHRLHVDSLAKLLFLAPEFDNHVKKIKDDYRIISNRRINMLLSTPDERYKWFLKYHGDLLQRVSNEIIASYLGIDPKTLSRIRKDMR